MLLSICIPTYNRGHRAYPLVEKLLKIQCQGQDEIEIILSNNGSDKNIEGYEKLKQLKNRKFHYYEFDKNMKYWGNYNQVIKMSKGDWCLLISDEDELIADNLEYYFEIIKTHKSLSVIKATSEFNLYENEIWATKGKEAVDTFFMKGNYLSGVMYNRKIITNELIDRLAERYSESNIAYYYYPHMFVEFYALINGDFLGGPRALIQMGEAISDQESYESEVVSLPAYTTFENRLQQLEGFVQMIADFEVSEAIKFRCFKMIIEKYITLLESSRHLMGGQVKKFMIGQIDKLGSKAVTENKNDFIEYINELVSYIL